MKAEGKTDMLIRVDTVGQTVIKKAYHPNENPCTDISMTIIMVSGVCDISYYY